MIDVWKEFFSSRIFFIKFIFYLHVRIYLNVRSSSQKCIVKNIKKIYGRSCFIKFVSTKSHIIIMLMSIGNKKNTTTLVINSMERLLYISYDILCLDRWFIYCNTFIVCRYWFIIIYIIYFFLFFRFRFYSVIIYILYNL